MNIRICVTMLGLAAAMAATPRAKAMTEQQPARPGEANQSKGTLDLTGARSGIQQPRNVVVRDAKAFAALWKQHQVAGTAPFPSVDFKKHDVVAVFAGSKPTGGYTVEIGEVKRAKEAATVAVVLLKPGPGSMVTQAFTSPFAMRAVPKLPKNVKFEVTEKAR
jgi:hypothetical protein